MRIGEEIWMPVMGYEGQYEVSNLGRVRGLRDTGGNVRAEPKMRAIHAGIHGYPILTLYSSSSKKTFAVHKIILEAFVGPRPAGYTASHLDGDVKNSTLQNLIWEPLKENLLRRHGHGTMTNGGRNGRAKLTDEMVLEIRSSTETHAAVAAQYSMSEIQIAKIRQRRCWRHLP